MRIFGELVPSLARVLDLAIVAAIVVVVHPLVPIDHFLADEDLLPWISVVLAIAAWLRGSTLGATSHPSLAEREGSTLRRWADRLSVGAVPLALYGVYDGARTVVATMELQALWTLAAGLLGVAGLVALAAYGRDHRRTAWNPWDGPRWFRLVVRLAATVGAVLLCGIWHGLVGDHPARWLSETAFVGLQFHTVGLIGDRLQVIRQRQAAGLRDGRAWRQPRFRYLLALFGPSISLLMIVALHYLIGWGSIDFGNGAVVSVHILAWTAVLWPGTVPVAVSCILHEVAPAGGKDQTVTDQALPFDQPPKGALRLNPLDIRRLRAIHHWMVRVVDPRIGGIDDPIRPLWAKRAVNVDWHVLGQAAFEPDPATGRPQWSVITIRLRDQHDLTRLGEGSAQTRRLVVLRAFPTPGTGLFGRMLRTYQWERRLPAGVLQVVDATTETLEIRNGDVLVLSTEGVARAFEVEIGSPIFSLSALGLRRTPQLEDYVGYG